ncbi:MAG: ATP-binding protein [Lachnospiraceae bacterium]|nr:ATP-binding protein [Lachnospiraceae bacterium]
MGIYLNPGNENFAEVLRSDIYVDKTMMISVTNNIMDSGNKYICMSHPRRFGKPIAGNMLASYYSKGCDSREMFKRLNIAQTPEFEQKLNKYNVIQLDLNSEYQNAKNRSEMLTYLQEKIGNEIKEQFALVTFSQKDSLTDMMLKIYSQTGETFIIIMDEYDVLVREQVDAALFDEYLSFLNGIFKSNTLRPAISLAYLTGILPIVRDKNQSKLNNFMEYTILDPGIFAPYVGFMADEVKELCGQYDMDFEECRRWYDGYRIGGNEIYNPESVVKSMIGHQYKGYWGMTSSYEVISDQIQYNFDGTKDAVVKMLAGEEVPVDVGSFLNTMNSFKTSDDCFTYLCHVGYLSYDETTEKCRIPNREVRKEWLRAIAVSSDYKTTDSIVKASEELLAVTIRGEEEFVARALDSSHIHVTSNRSYNNEDALQSAIYLAYIYALNKYTVIREMTSGKGFADVVFIPFYSNLPAMVIELKHNKCAESALDQIREKKYFDSLAHYKGELLLVGISYDEKEKNHECRIERLEKE